jgi:hypothetical protein
MRAVVAAGLLLSSVFFTAFAEAADRLDVAQCAELSLRPGMLGACKTHEGCKLVLNVQKSCANAAAFLDNLELHAATRAVQGLGTRTRIEANDVFEAAIGAPAMRLDGAPESRDLVLKIRKLIAEKVTAKGNRGLEPAISPTATEPPYVYYGETAQGRPDGAGIRFFPDGRIWRGQFKAGRFRDEAGQYGESVNAVEGSRSVVSTQAEGRAFGAAVTPKGTLRAGVFGASGYLEEGRIAAANGFEERGKFAPSDMLLEGTRMLANGTKETGTFSPTGRNELMRGTRTAPDGTSSPVEFAASAIQPLAALPSSPPPSAPSTEERAQACRNDADRCETACAAGSLIGMLLSGGKADGQSANAQCAANCQAGQRTCLAQIGGSGAEAAAPSMQPRTPTASGAREFCSPRGEWCAYENSSLHPPYKLLKAACSLYGVGPGMAGKIALQLQDTTDAGLRGIASEKFIAVSRNPREREWARTRAENAKCILASGLLEFQPAAKKYFYPDDVKVVEPFPNVAFNEVEQSLRQNLAKGLSTQTWGMVAGPGQRRLQQLENFRSKHFSHGAAILAAPSANLPISWWAANLASLEAIRASVSDPVSGLDEELASMRAHRDAGWPYAAENVMWIRFAGKGRLR